MIFRKPTLQDYFLVYELIKEDFPHINYQYYENLINYSDSYSLLTIMDNIIVGMIVCIPPYNLLYIDEIPFSFNDYSFDKNYIALNKIIFVHKNYRGKKIAKLMFNMIKDQLKLIQVKSIVSFGWMENKDAILFIKSFGGREIKVILNAWTSLYKEKNLNCSICKIGCNCSALECEILI